MKALDVDGWTVESVLTDRFRLAAHPRRLVLPRHPRESGEKVGIHFDFIETLDSRFRGNDVSGIKGMRALDLDMCSIEYASI